MEGRCVHLSCPGSCVAARCTMAYVGGPASVLEGWAGVFVAVHRSQPPATAAEQHKHLIPSAASDGESVSSPYVHGDGIFLVLRPKKTCPYIW